MLLGTGAPTADYLPVIQKAVAFSVAEYLEPSQNQLPRETDKQTEGTNECVCEQWIFVTPAGSAAGVIYTTTHRKHTYVHERSMSMSSLHLDVCGVSMAVHGHGRLRPLSLEHALLSTSPADASKQAPLQQQHRHQNCLAKSSRSKTKNEAARLHLNLISS